MLKVPDSTIRRRLNEYCLFGRVPRRKPLLSKKSMKARLRSAKRPQNKSRGFTDKVLPGTDEI